MSSIYYQIILLILIIILIPILFIPTLSADSIQNNIPTTSSDSKIEITSSGLIWPTPGYTRINSYFGYRTSPTKFASSFHQGIDIGAPAGTYIVAVSDAIVTHIGFSGSGGYSITLKANHLEFIYHHVSPHYIISLGEQVKSGQLIGQVGPKNVYGIKNNPYKDANGNPTNGATTGPHLHFTIKKDGKAVNPLNYFK